MGVISESIEAGRESSDDASETQGTPADPFLDQYDTGQFDTDLEAVADGLSILASITRLL